tara:strand:- start:258 stop:476 length:219 start_codon:yes stop_codon:yes gene_type:complete
MFKYHPDNTIYRNGNYYGTFDEFKNEFPTFPLVLGKFFEYANGKFSFVNEEGHHTDAKLEENAELIKAINSL